MKKYTKQQKQLITHVINKVKILFTNFPIPAHGIDHIERVVKWATIIAEKEKAKNPFLCELSAWLHDIGHTLSLKPKEKRSHHELSYILLKQWFQEDREFDFLNDAEKIELLYAVRYHYNDQAIKYDTAWILRDADKLDGFGEIGMKRANEYFKDDKKGFNDNLRFMFSNLLFLKTKTAHKIVSEKNLMVPVYNEHEKILKARIEEINLNKLR